MSRIAESAANLGIVLNMSGIFDQTTVYQVQQANDIVDVVGEYVRLTRKGREMVGLCPFHDDHRPSLNVSNVKQIFKCWACGAGGDVIKFVQMRENLTFPQAIERLAQRAGIKLTPRKPTDRANDTPNINPNELAKLNVWATEHFHTNLLDKQKGRQTRSYLTERKIALETAKKWQLGLALSQNNLLQAAKAKGISEKILAAAGLVVIDRNAGLVSDKFVNRLMFPITDATGRVIGFGGRTLDQTRAKYINSPTTPLFDKSNCLYGLAQARRDISSSATAVVVEGYTDCIMAHQFGCSNVVATLGTSFTKGHARILRRYAKKIVLIFDSDAAGLEAANRALEICLAQPIDIKIAAVPQGKDPCDFLLTAGTQPFQELVDQAVDVFQFKWDRLTQSLNTADTFTDNKAAIEQFLQTIATGLKAGNLPLIETGLVVNRLTGIIGLSKKEINHELGKRIKKGATRSPVANDVTAETQQDQSANLGEGFFAAAQRELLEVLLNKPGLFEVVRKEISANLFDVPALKQIATILFQTLDEDINAPLRAVLAKVESTGISNLIMQLAGAGEEKKNFQARLNGALDAIQRHRKQERKNLVGAKEDQTQFLKCLVENTGKQNPHTLGMV